MKTLHQTTLYFREGPSDKVYQVTLEASGKLCVVNFAYGRCGSAMTTGTKTETPVWLDEGMTIYKRLIAEKKYQGYQEGEADAPAASPLPQLLNAIEESVVA